ncbi:MAG: ThiF family adenylyltransferase [Ignavibacteriae bacterium]|nr:ThiF family adenylyltransferase [Ignavibacteriota bacterium]
MEQQVNSLQTDINSRQKNLLGDYTDQVAIVVGLGGIGSWLAIDLALMGVGTIIMFDPDTIEASNLNRTLFKLNHIGKLKTKAIEELIKERRRDITVMSYNEYFTVEHFKKFKGFNYLFDCSDTTRLKDAINKYNSENIKTFNYVKLGYDGFNGTICVNDFDSGKWGEDSSYTVTPSFFAPPQILSALGITELTIRAAQTRTTRINLKTILTKLNKAVEN